LIKTEAIRVSGRLIRDKGGYPKDKAETDHKVQSITGKEKIEQPDDSKNLEGPPSLALLGYGTQPKQGAC